MDSRRRFVIDVWSGEVSFAEACRRSDITRRTGRKWVRRAEEQGFEEMAELSRAPKTVARKTAASVERSLLDLRARYPEWGARKLVVLLDREEGIQLPSRTADHILERHGLTSPRPKLPEFIRFEKEECGAMLQMDFKGLPQGLPYCLLSVLDDHGRFCLAFEPVPDKTAATVRSFLWNLFGQHGLPDSMLMDNGDGWGAISRFPTAFDLWLMRQGIRPIHGRPCHPQTQGKVERFHRTAKLEIGSDIVQPSLDLVRPVCKAFVDRYNWVRPHDALGGRVPGSTYQPFPRKRPSSEPHHEIPEAATTRKIDASGFLYYKGKTIKVGKGLIGERVVIQEDLLGERLFYSGIPLLYLHEI